MEIAKKKITSTEKTSKTPRISKDGRYIYFAQYDGIKKNDIYRIDSAGNNQEKIISDTDDPILKNMSLGLFDISPDQTFIMVGFLRFDTYEKGIGIIDIIKKKFKVINIPNLQEPYDPNISPDGKEFLFVANSDLNTCKFSKKVTQYSQKK